MGAPIDPKAVEIHISTVLTPGSFVWNKMLNLTSHSRDGTPASTSQVFVFGQTAPYTSTTGVVDNYSHSGLYDPADATGQVAFVNAARASPVQDVVLAFLHDNTASAEAGYYQQITPTGEGESGEREGTFVEASFTATGSGTKTPFTGGMPA